jgi:hypothetical protein
LRKDEMLVVVAGYVVAAAEDELERHHLEWEEKQMGLLVSSDGMADLDMGEEASFVEVLSHGVKAQIRHHHHHRPYLCPSP